MKKSILTFGLAAGAIVSLILIVSVPYMAHSAWSMVAGFGSMLLAFSLMIPAIKSYRDRQAGGAISFGKAFGIGLGIAAIASVCYTLTWAILYKNFYPNFLDQYQASELASMVKKGKSAAQLAAARTEFSEMSATYNTWPGLVGYTMMEIFPLGVVVALVVALVMKRKRAGAE